jgi:hypothetical protein
MKPFYDAIDRTYSYGKGNTESNVIRLVPDLFWEEVYWAVRYSFECIIDCTEEVQNRYLER